jgi:DNA-binding transcriptional MerR regulator
MEDLSLQEVNAFIEALRKDSQVKDAKIQEQDAMLQEQSERILELEMELDMLKKGKNS